MEDVTEPRSPGYATIEAQIVWGDVEALPVLPASHFALQAAVHDAPNLRDVVLTVGFLPPPMLQGTSEQQREAVSKTAQVAIRPLARFVIPLGKAAELRELLDGFVQAMRDLELPVSPTPKESEKDQP